VWSAESVVSVADAFCVRRHRSSRCQQILMLPPFCCVFDRPSLRTAPAPADTASAAAAVAAFLAGSASAAAGSTTAAAAVVSSDGLPNSRNSVCCAFGRAARQQKLHQHQQHDLRLLPRSLRQVYPAERVPSTAHGLVGLAHGSATRPVVPAAAGAAAPTKAASRFCVDRRQISVNLSFGSWKVQSAESAVSAGAAAILARRRSSSRWQQIPLLLPSAAFSTGRLFGRPARRQKLRLLFLRSWQGLHQRQRNLRPLLLWSRRTASPTAETAPAAVLLDSRPGSSRICASSNRVCACCYGPFARPTRPQKVCLLLRMAWLG
jgi:hypothetical protein